MCAIAEITRVQSARFRFFAFVAAALVVYIHVPYAGVEPSSPFFVNFFSRGVCAVAVPFFFFAAGFFLAGHVNDGAGWWIRELEKRLRSIGIPYLIWGFLWALEIIVLYILSNETARQRLAIKYQSAINPLMAFGLIPNVKPCLGVLWFLRALLVVVIAAPAVVGIVRLPYATGLALLAALYLGLPEVLNALGASSCVGGLFDYGVLSLSCWFHFSFGVWVRLHPHVNEWLHRRSFVTFAVGLSLLFLLGFGDVFGAGGLGESVAKLAITMLYLGCAYAVPVSTDGLVVLSLSFPLCLVHRLLLVPIRFLCMKLGCDYRPSSIGWYLAMVALTIFASLISVAVMRRLLPRFTSLAFGGRVR